MLVLVIVSAGFFGSVKSREGVDTRDRPLLLELPLFLSLSGERKSAPTWFTCSEQGKNQRREIQEIPNRRNKLARAVRIAT